MKGLYEAPNCELLLAEIFGVKIEDPGTVCNPQCQEKMCFEINRVCGVCPCLAYCIQEGS